MAPPVRSRGFAAAAAVGLSLALLLPAQAQFWGDWGGRPQRQQRYDNPFGGGWVSPSPRWGYDGREREREVDYSRAPGPSQKKPEATTSIVVMGDANADWLAYGLEEAFSEKPEIGIVRKHRTDSGLIRYDQRRDSNEWAQIAREIVAAEKPKFIVMMIGNNDRQQIREKVPPAVKPAAKPATGQAEQPAAAGAAAPVPATPPQPVDAEQQVEAQEPPPANLTPEQA